MLVRQLIVQYRARPDLPAYTDDTFRTPRDSAAFLRPILENEAVEVFIVLCLSTTHQLLAYHELGRGTIDAVQVSPRDVFKTALLANAAAIIVGHNHPSGDPTPSFHDLDLTRTLVDGAALMGVELLDHIIVAGDRYYSFKEVGSGGI